MIENIRRLERERALSLLYEADIKGEPVVAVLAELPVTAEPFVERTVLGVGAELRLLDELIDRFAIGWTAERMAVIDRNILRVGAWELLRSPELPVAVIISEAVELAKQFSTLESGKFVNGILSALASAERG